MQNEEKMWTDQVISHSSLPIKENRERTGFTWGHLGAVFKMTTFEDCMIISHGVAAFQSSENKKKQKNSERLLI